MLGLMQQQPLMISSIIKHAARHHSDAEIVSKTVEGAIHRYTYADAERAARRLARAMQGLGVRPGDRVATLAWNGYRHFEIYYATSGSQAICHTVNPRLHQDDIIYILNHAGSCLLFSDTSFAPLIATIAPRVSEHVRAIVMMTDEAHMPAIGTPMPLLCYDTFTSAADDDYEWPSFDENTAASLCYTSGTTGRPKGVLYSHRSTILHAYAVASADAMGLRATDRLMPVVPMFHVNAWGTPYTAPLIGSALVMPGRHLDGESVATLMNDERVTLSAGVPTVWMGLLQYLRASGKRLDTVKRIITGGSACPPLLLEAFGSEYGITVEHAWGMTELSPVGSYNKPKARQEGLTGEAWLRHNLKQGRTLFGIDMKIVDDDDQELPWDGVRFGELKVRGPWVASAYYGDPPDSACDENGWFKTGDVCTIDADGFMEITDRSKDVIKSGGEWISSITLENIAVSHPDIAEAAVIAARHEKWDERPLLIVVPREGANVTPDSVLATYENKVPKWWLPDAVILVDALPHTATGKLQKSALRVQYGNYLINAP